AAREAASGGRGGVGGGGGGGRGGGGGAGRGGPGARGGGGARGGPGPRGGGGRPPPQPRHHGRPGDRLPVRGAAPRYHPPAGPPPLAAAGGKPVSLSYHQNVFDLLDLGPKASPEALRDLEECERRAGARVPARL